MPAAGVPRSTPFGPSITPLGSVPVSENVGAGKPVAVTRNEPATPVVKVVLPALVIAGGWSTLRVKDCTASGDTPLEAVIVIGYAPPVPAAAVPLSNPAELSVTSLGRAPVSENVGTGKPVAVTLKVPAVPTLNAVLLALVILGASSTVSVKLCVAFGKMPLVAVITIGYTPPVPAAGIPASTPAALKVTPFGSAPVSEKVGGGKPVAVTLNEPVDPTLKVALFALVILGD